MNALPPLTRVEMAALRMQYAMDARSDLLAFTQFMMPDPNVIEDPRASLYEIAPFHRLIAERCEACVVKGGKRFIINTPPRHGKSQLATLSFIPWYIGNFPRQSVIFGTYNEVFARDIGRKVKTIMQSAAYRQVFPEIKLKKGTQSASQIGIVGGGDIFFVGRGGTVTGRGGHLLVLDDPIKDAEEARSEVTRQTLWEWYNRTIGSRLMTDVASVLLIQTRWHQDDLVGRLTDPANPYYLKAEARQWDTLNLPALATEDNDLLGRKQGDPLWPERFSKDWLNSRRRADPHGFAALYQGEPTLKDGAFFSQQIMQEYDPKTDLPRLEDMTLYSAADLAVADSNRNDKSCVITVGVDRNDNLYVLPDIVWGRYPADQLTDQMMRIMKTYPLRVMYTESGQISRSIGPFLRKRMSEEGVFCALDEIAPRGLGDKSARATAILGRMSSGKVFFPSTAHWWPDAQAEMLAFPRGARDDFVDALAYVGVALSRLMPGTVARQGGLRLKPNSFGAMLKTIREEDALKRRMEKSSGW